VLEGLVAWVIAATRSRLRCSSFSSSRSVTMASAFFSTYLQDTYINRDRAIGSTQETKEMDRSLGFIRSPSSAIKNHPTLFQQLKRLTHPEIAVGVPDGI